MRPAETAPVTHGVLPALQHPELTSSPGAIRHVLMTADAVGGVWTYALDLARALGERGVRTSIALMGPPPSDPQRDQVASMASLEMFESPFNLEWMDEPWHDVEKAGEWLLALERDLNPDIVHLNGFCHAGLPWRAPVLVAGHSCVLSWWRSVHGSDAPAKWDRYAEGVARGLRAAGLVVAPTRAMLQMLDHHYGPIARKRVIPNGRYPSAPTGIQTSVKEPMVLTAGRLWDHAKNADSVCAVAPYVPWPVYVAGETKRPDGGEVQTRGAHYLGWLPPREIAGWMARAAIFALPARYEPFGLTPLEAALAGCALVLGDIRSLREVWSDTALYVPPDNRRALAAAIEGLIADEDHRRSLAHRAQERARTMTPRRMADGYLSAYRDLANLQLTTDT